MPNAIYQESRRVLVARYGHLTDRELRIKFREISEANGHIVNGMVGNRKEFRDEHGTITGEGYKAMLDVLKTDPNYVRNVKEMNDIERYEKHKNNP